MKIAPYQPGWADLDISQLEQLYQETQDTETRTQLQIVLLARQGQPVPEIARLTQLSEEAVQDCLAQANYRPAQKLRRWPDLSGSFWIRAGLATFFVALLLTHYDDQEFKLRDLTFIMWFLAIGQCYYGLRLLEPGSKFKFQLKRPNWPEFLPMLGVTVIATLTSLLFLTIYPFVSIGDEMRDTGIYTLQLANGEIKNIYGYGFESAYGLIVPQFASLFYHLFGNSLLTIRIPAALIAILDSVLLYQMLRQFINRKVGLWAALVMISLPLHLYYARVELVVIFSSFLTTAILFALGLLLQKRTLKNFGQLGLLLGFSMGFYASVRTVILLTLVIVVIICGYYFWKKIERQTLLNGFGLLLLLALVGFGPRLLFSPPEALLHTSRLVQEEQKPGENSLLNRLKLPFERYPQSLMVYIYEPAVLKWHGRQPILPTFLAPFFLVGLFLALMPGSARYRNPWLTVVAFFALLLPFTNSALTNIVNADFRLSPYWPVASILVAYGMAEVFARLHDFKIGATLLYPALAFITLVFLGYSVVWFFNSETATYGMYRTVEQESNGFQDYMVMYTIKTIQQQPALKNRPSLCLLGSKTSADFLRLNHIKEQFSYYLPRLKFEVQEASGELPDNTIYIADGCGEPVDDGNWASLNYCQPYQKFVCPPDKKQFIIWTRSV